MTTHSDRDGSESRTLGGCMWCHADACDHGARLAAPAGLPLHESADRDADNVPSDRVRAYADVLRWTRGMTTHAKAQACAALEEHHTAKLWVENERLRDWQREVCDQFGYDSGEPGATEEVLTFLPVWRGEAAGNREYADRAQAIIARAEARLTRLLRYIQEECDDDLGELICHSHDRTDDGRCALVADLEAAIAALRGPEPTDAP